MLTRECEWKDAMCDGPRSKRRALRETAVVATLALLVACGAAWAGQNGDEIEVAVRPAPLRELNKKHEVRLVHFVPQDREPEPHHRQKIRVVMTFVADLYRRDLRSKGCPTDGLDFEFEDGRPVVHLLRGKRPAAYYTGAPDYDGLRQWKKIVAEMRSGMGPVGEHAYVVFPQTCDPGEAEHAWPGDVALGARFTDDGGMALVPGWMLRDEFAATSVEAQLRLMADETPIEGRTALGHGKENSPRYEFIEDSVGAVAHELGHVFGLVHDHRRPWQYVMGNGFRRIRENYLRVGAERPVRFSEDNARILAQSRFLAPRIDRSDERAPSVKTEVSGPLEKGQKAMEVRVRAEDDGELGAILFFVSNKDSVVGGGPLSGASVTLRRKLPVGPLDEGEFKLVVLVADEGGRLTRDETTCRVRPGAD